MLVREGEREGGWERGREGEREGGREGRRKGGKEAGEGTRNGITRWYHLQNVMRVGYDLCCLHWIRTHIHMLIVCCLHWIRTHIHMLIVHTCSSYTHA